MKKIYFLVAVLLFIISSTGVKAQNTAPVWVGDYNGTGDNSDGFSKIISDGSGNYLCTGYTYRRGNYADILTVKINSNGDTLWWKTKNGKNNGDDKGVDVGIDASGNVFVAGTVDNGKSGLDIIVIKYDQNGVVQWDTTWNSPAYLDDRAVALKVDGAGNCIVGGNVMPDTFANSTDYITLKFAGNGTFLWSAQYSRGAVAHGRDELTGLALDAAGDVFVTGRSDNGTNDDYMTVKYNGSTGSQITFQTYNGGGNDRATSVKTDHSGNVIVTGRSDNGSDYDFRTICYYNSLTFRWSRGLNSPASQDDRAVSIAIGANNEVHVTGNADVDPFATVDYDFETVKYDSLGTLPSVFTVRTGNVVSQDDVPAAIELDNSGNVFVTGKSDMNPDPAVTDYDFMTVMYNSAGAIQWNNSPSYHSGTFTGGDDAAVSLVPDNSGSLYVAGESKNLLTVKDATVVKYNVSSGAETWAKDYNGEGDYSDDAKAVVVDINKNSYAAGYSFSYGQNLNACISKFGPAGNLLCSYNYNGAKNDDDEFSDIAISSGGQIYAAGYTKVTGQKSNFLLVKWDPSACDTVWTRTYDFVGQSDKAVSIVLDASGNIYLTGRSDANVNDTIDNNDIVTIKYDPNGNALWTSRYDGPSGQSDEPVKIILDHNGDVIVAGNSTNGHDDIFAIKYNPSNGSAIWASPIIYNSNFGNDDRVKDVTVDGMNNIFLAGYSQTGSVPNTNDPVLLKYSASGSQTGFNSFSGNGNDEVVRVVTDINDNVYALYKYDTQPGASSNSYDILLKKFDNQLVTSLWSNPPQYNSPVNEDDVPADMKITTSGFIFVTGTTDNDTTGGKVNQNWITLGYDDQGQQVFSSNVDGPNNTDDSPNALQIVGNDMWVCGYMEGTGNSQRNLSVAYYALTVDVADLNNNVSATAYPNPFSDNCTISINKLSKNNSHSIAVYDMLGNDVIPLQVFSGNTTRISKGGLASGIYEYRISEGSSVVAHGKLIIN